MSFSFIESFFFVVLMVRLLFPLLLFYALRLPIYTQYPTPSQKGNQPPPGQIISSVVILTPFLLPLQFTSGVRLSLDYLTLPYQTRYSLVGYKVHLTETCDADSPNLITQVETILAAASDISVMDDIYTDLSQKNLLPAEHIVDTAYVSADWLVKSPTDYRVDLLGPAHPDISWQARAGQGFDVAHFVMDWERHCASCPMGKTSVLWVPHRARNGNPVIKVDFDPADCRICPSRSLCTRSKSAGRSLSVLPKDQQLALQAARQRQLSEDFKQRYALRAGVEGTISQSTYARDMRQTRYCGLDKTHFQNVATAVAINLALVLAWLSGLPRAQSRQSHFAALAA